MNIIEGISIWNKLSWFKIFIVSLCGLLIIESNIYHFEISNILQFTFYFITNFIYVIEFMSKKEKDCDRVIGICQCRVSCEGILVQGKELITLKILYTSKWAASPWRVIIKVITGIITVLQPFHPHLFTCS